MRIAITGASGLIGPPSSRRCGSTGTTSCASCVGNRRTRTRSGGIRPAASSIRRRRGRGRDRAPRGREHRKALERRPAPPDPRVAHARHRAGGRGGFGPRATARPAVRLGGRLLRSAGRRETHRGRAARRGLPRRGGRGVEVGADQDARRVPMSSTFARPDPRPARGDDQRDAAAVQARARRTRGSGDQWWSWVALDDVVAAYLFALDRPLAGTFNLVAPGVVRNRDFVAALGDVLHRRPCSPCRRPRSASFGVTWARSSCSEGSGQCRTGFSARGSRSPIRSSGLRSSTCSRRTRRHAAGAARRRSSRARTGGSPPPCFVTPAPRPAGCRSRRG